ncbi:hypothetical protein PF586_03410 [Lactobacillus delbrueckii]|uniref:Arc family DNA-binding protein n=1 Tax=Lactobacillus delbrueckii TaxID=1584 RepID=A0AAW5YUF6_9LACO|nr:YlcI/YnfO family protein [Lactobacillus delbrueckii]MDA3767536.1 hypothetical protein [Lactobacillus delbrueckii]
MKNNKIRKNIRFPDWLIEELEADAEMMGKSTNSMIIDACADYVQDFDKQYAVFKSKHQSS